MLFYTASIILKSHVKELRALRGFFVPPVRLKIKKNVFHQFVLISLLEQ